MPPPAHTERYKNHRFPGEIISHGVWLYYRFHLSYRDVQELLFERGSDVTYARLYPIKPRSRGYQSSGSAVHRGFPPYRLSQVTCKNG
jgi:putative transposase